MAVSAEKRPAVSLPELLSRAEAVGVELGELELVTPDGRRVSFRDPNEVDIVDDERLAGIGAALGPRPDQVVVQHHREHRDDHTHHDQHRVRAQDAAQHALVSAADLLEDVIDPLRELAFVAADLDPIVVDPASAAATPARNIGTMPPAIAARSISL